jgi:type III secretion system low calcium response chaperone LcrH/SycD
MSDPHNQNRPIANKTLVADFLQKGGSVQELYNISARDSEVMFAAASRYLSQNQWNTAADCFLFLTFLNPYQTRNWMGLGESHRMAGDWDKAIDVYTIAISNEDDDPRPHFHLANCYLAKNMGNEALSSLETTLETCKGKNKFASLTETCRDLIDTIQNRLKKD